MNTYVGWSAVPTLIGSHLFSPYPDRLDRDAPGTAQPENTGTNSFGDALNASHPGGDSYFRHRYCNPNWKDAADAAGSDRDWRRFGGLLDDMPPLERVNRYAADVNPTTLVPVKIGTGNTVEKWRIDDAERQLRDMLVAKNNTVFLEHLYVSGTTTGSGSAENYWGGGGANYDRVMLYLEAADKLNDAGELLNVIPMLDFSGSTPSESAAVNAIKAINKYASPLRVTIGATTYMVVMPYLPERQAVSYWQGLETASAAAGVPVMFAPCFVDWAHATQGANAWVAAGLCKAGLSRWDSRNVEASPVGGSDAYIDLAATATQSGWWIQVVAPGDERRRSRKFDESKFMQNIRAMFGRCRHSTNPNRRAKGIQFATWNDYSEGTQVAPSRKKGSLDPATLDPRYGLRTDLGDARISWVGLYAVQYIDNFVSGTPIPLNDTVWMGMRKHQYAAIPTHPLYTISAQLTPTSKGTATPLEIEGDTRSWQTGVRSLVGGVWSFNPTPGGFTRAVDRVFLVTQFAEPTQIEVTVNGVIPSVVGEVFEFEAPAGAQEFSFPWLPGTWAVAATRNGEIRTLTHPLVTTNSIVVQDFAYWPHGAAWTFPEATTPGPAGPAIPVYTDFDMKGISRLRNLPIAESAAQVPNWGQVLDAINSAIGTQVENRIQEVRRQERRLIYKRLLGSDQGLFTVEKGDATVPSLALTTGIAVVSRVYPLWDLDSPAVRFYGGSTPASGLSYNRLGLYRYSGTQWDLIGLSADIGASYGSSGVVIEVPWTEGVVNISEDDSLAIAALQIGTTTGTLIGQTSATGAYSAQSPWSSGQLTATGMGGSGALTALPPSFTDAQLAASGTNTRRIQALIVEGAPE